MLTNKLLIVKISTKLIIQVIVAFILSVIILFFIHYKVDAGYDGFSVFPNMNLDCPLNQYNLFNKYHSHVFYLSQTPNGVEFPNYKKMYFLAGISHWGYLLIGTLILTLLFQIKIKLEVEPINKANEFINNGKPSKTLELFVIILIILAGFYLIYALQASL